MFCGLRSFRRIDDIEDQWPPRSQSLKESTKKKKKKKKADENPYSTLGLDKFSTVLADLEARKARIMAVAGRASTTTVYFMYSDSNECVPVVVKLEDQKQDATKQFSRDLKPPPAVVAHAEKEDVEEALQDAKDEATSEMDAVPEKKVKKSLWLWEVKGHWSWRNWSWPSYSWPLVLVLILVCLLMFGRVFAICCTSIWWYLVPLMQGEGKNDRRSIRKRKGHGGRMNDNKISSPQAKKMDGVKVRSPPRGH